MLQIEKRKNAVCVFGVFRREWLAHNAHFINSRKNNMMNKRERERERERERKKTQKQIQNILPQFAFRTQKLVQLAKKCTRATDSTAIVLRLSSGALFQRTNKQKRITWREQDTAFDLFAIANGRFVIACVWVLPPPPPPPPFFTPNQLPKRSKTKQTQTKTLSSTVCSEKKTEKHETRT